MFYWVLAALACSPLKAAVVSTGAPAGFVQVLGTQLVIDTQPYHFVGANLWYAENLAAQGPGGDRARLLRELDRLKDLGVNNLRIMGLSQGPQREPWRIVPPLEVSERRYDKVLLEGLDFLLSEMAKRGQRAVIVLNNFEPWSGGMAQYYSWSSHEAIPYPPPEPGGDLNAYQDFAADFYGDRKAVDWSHQAIKMLLTRRNGVTNSLYKDDPVIMAWELAEAPRGRSHAKDFNAWIDQTASYIKSLDPHHLVTTGCEGQTSMPDSAGLDFTRNHSPKSIDYATIHVWPQEWGWYDPASTDTFDAAAQKAREYIDWHEAQAVQFKKPLVIEEFGLARDSASFEPKRSTVFRDSFTAVVLEEAYRLSSSTHAVAGADFWAWAGEGRPAQAGGFWLAGQSWTGDSPDQKQGLYGVYDTDAGTADVVKRFAAMLRGSGR